MEVADEGIGQNGVAVLGTEGVEPQRVPSPKAICCGRSLVVGLGKEA
jgi:hypothetical protein